jgi:hypothetical protein
VTAFDLPFQVNLIETSTISKVLLVGFGPAAKGLLDSE